MIHTYMTHASPSKTMQSLDTQTLKKVRSDALVVLKALRRGRGGWAPHPVVRQWSGYENALVVYINAAIRECNLRHVRGGPHEPLPIPGKVLLSPWWYKHSTVHKESFFVWKGSKPQTIWPRGLRFPGHFTTIEPDATIL